MRTDPQNDVFSPEGATWELVGRERRGETGRWRQIEQPLAAAKQAGTPVLRPGKAAQAYESYVQDAKGHDDAPAFLAQCAIADRAQKCRAVAAQPSCTAL